MQDLVLHKNPVIIQQFKATSSKAKKKTTTMTTTKGDRVISFRS